MRREEKEKTSVRTAKDVFQRKRRARLRTSTLTEGVARVEVGGAVVLAADPGVVRAGDAGLVWGLLEGIASVWGRRAAVTRTGGHSFGRTLRAVERFPSAVVKRKERVRNGRGRLGLPLRLLKDRKKRRKAGGGREGWRQTGDEGEREREETERAVVRQITRRQH